MKFIDKTQPIIRPASVDDEKRIAETKKIINDVKENKDAALKRYTEQFDGVALNALKTSQEEFEQAMNQISDEVKAAIHFAKQKITINNEAFFPKTKTVETSEGVFCQKQFRAIERVGLYIPGGSAPLVSTLLMLLIPANIAGCTQKIICTPPNRFGKIHPAILYAAQLCGVNDVYKIGGAQAIAAMTYGTESIPRVQKIFGPGNAWVTTAKKLVSTEISIDLPAGPSELLIIADDHARADFIAADLLSQAEHSSDAQVVFLTTSLSLAQNVQVELQKQLKKLERRDIAAQSLNTGAMILVESIEEGIQLSNLYAPEHLMLHIKNPEAYVPLVKHAGSVFLGSWAPETVGDYVTGSNHVLPTNGYAQSVGGLSVLDFMKPIYVQAVTQTGLKMLKNAAETLAELEGLTAHKNAVSIRFQNEE